MNYCYLKEYSVLPPYLQFPEFLLDLSISQTAKITYMVLYDRARLSQKNKWLDKDERIYIIFTLNELCERIGRGQTAVKQALNDLTAVGLIKRKKGGFSKPNHIYVHIPFDSRFPELDGKETSRETENSHSNSRKTNSDKVGISAPNKVIETSNIKQSNRNSSRSQLKNSFGKSLIPDYSCTEGESL